MGADPIHALCAILALQQKLSLFLLVIPYCFAILLR